MKWWPWSKDKDDEGKEKKREEPFFDPHAAALAGVTNAEDDGRKEPMLETPFRLDLQHGQDRLVPVGDQQALAVGREAQGLAIEAQLQIIADATDIADADREERLLEAVEAEVVAQAQARRQAELVKSVLALGVPLEK